jgi:hypothetical protein
MGQEDLDCRARFIRPTPLAVTRSGNGSGSVAVTDLDLQQPAIPDPVSGVWTFDIDTRVRLTATPMDGSVFTGWLGD